MGATRKIAVSEHTYDNHHPHGKGAKTPGARKDLFPEWMTKEDMNKSISRAFRVKRKIGGRQPNYKGENRQQFIGYDRKSGLSIVFWYNHTTKIIETAWPDWQHKYEHRNQAKDGR